MLGIKREVLSREVTHDLCFQNTPLAKILDGTHFLLNEKLLTGSSGPESLPGSDRACVRVPSAVKEVSQWHLRSAE